MVTVRQEAMPISSRVCGAYSFEITNADGTKSLCLGCDLQRDGKCTRRGIPVIGNTNFHVTDPAYVINSAKMGKLAEELRISCVTYP